MATQGDINTAIATAQRSIQALLKRQAPVKTGALKRSIRVQGRQVRDDVEFTISSLDYGKYTDLGTKRYRTTNRRPWNPSPGKGRGGIKPRFWKTIERALYVGMMRRIAKITAQFTVIRLFR